MIEKAIYDFLDENMSYPVFMEIPKSSPEKFYVIEKTGSSESNHISSSTFAIQSYATSLYEAADMNEDLKQVMLNDLIEEDIIASVQLNSDYNYTDTTTKRYRYQAVFDIVHY
ncbi:MAG: hypothetical protein IIZ78_18190 [Clostridiales bacterium]|nr:hypothetical protein [Clostridiales bacterium]